eukprot:JP446097.1.p1 GENE.JP446097.1~~JP446097.1.p1  ORF type:complete len:494 (+),score=195.19 JP446097.1:112-1482(+)
MLIAAFAVVSAMLFVARTRSSDVTLEQLASAPTDLTLLREQSQEDAVDAEKAKMESERKKHIAELLAQKKHDAEVQAQRLKHDQEMQQAEAKRYEMEQKQQEKEEQEIQLSGSSQLPEQAPPPQKLRAPVVKSSLATDNLSKRVARNENELSSVKEKQQKLSAEQKALKNRLAELRKAQNSKLKAKTTPTKSDLDSFDAKLSRLESDLKMKQELLAAKKKESELLAAIHKQEVELNTQEARAASTKLTQLKRANASAAKLAQASKHSQLKTKAVHEAVAKQDKNTDLLNQVHALSKELAEKNEKLNKLKQLKELSAEKEKLSSEESEKEKELKELEAPSPFTEYRPSLFDSTPATSHLENSLSAKEATLEASGLSAAADEHAPRDLLSSTLPGELGKEYNSKYRPIPDSLDTQWVGFLNQDNGDKEVAQEHALRQSGDPSAVKVTSSLLGTPASSS